MNCGICKCEVQKEHLFECSDCKIKLCAICLHYNHSENTITCEKCYFKSANIVVKKPSFWESFPGYINNGKKKPKPKPEICIEYNEINAKDMSRLAINPMKRKVDYIYNVMCKKIYERALKGFNTIYIEGDYIWKHYDTSQKILEKMCKKLKQKGFEVIMDKSTTNIKISWKEEEKCLNL